MGIVLKLKIHRFILQKLSCSETRLKDGNSGLIFAPNGTRFCKKNITFWCNLTDVSWRCIMFDNDNKENDKDE